LFLFGIASIGEYVMNAIDLTPFYRSSVGFDRLGSLINHALNSESTSTGYPPYNIEIVDENRYAISLAVAGFSQEELSLEAEKGVLTVRGDRHNKNEREYLYQGIANRTFERKFNLADHVEVSGADLVNGMLTISLLKEVPDVMKPRSIPIHQNSVIADSKASKKIGKGE